MALTVDSFQRLYPEFADAPPGLVAGKLTEARVQGVAVPQRLAVVGFGDLEFAGALAPSLTTVHIKGAAIGRQAAQFIVDRAEGRPVDQPVVDIGFSIIERQSS